MTIKEIVGRVALYRCPLVEITGGEPLLQKETPALVHELLRKNFHVLLETNGSRDIGVIDEQCVRIVDIKCPSSGEHEKNRWENLKLLTVKDEIKFVMATREDYEFAKAAVVRMRETPVKTDIIHFSPVFGQLNPPMLAAWILEDRLPVRLHLQLHKILWIPTGGEYRSNP